jgi:hypothetical protein
VNGLVLEQFFLQQSGRYPHVAENGVRFAALSNTDGIASALGFASPMMTNMIVLGDGRLRLGVAA